MPSDDAAPRPASHPSGLLAPVAIIACTAASAALGGLVSGGESDPWYQDLNRAPGNPPGWVFGVVWPLLYGLMAAGAIMTWRAAKGWGAAQLPMSLFGAQLVANLGWSVLFFGLHAPLAAFVLLSLLWVMIALMMRSFRAHSRLAAVLQTPYLVWVTFAGYLNGWVVLFNA